MRDASTYRGDRRNAMRKDGISAWRQLRRIRTKHTGTRWDKLKDGTLRSFQTATYIMGGL
jgi:hypothetical protein